MYGIILFVFYRIVLYCIVLFVSHSIVLYRMESYRTVCFVFSERREARERKGGGGGGAGGKEKRKPLSFLSLICIISAFPSRRRVVSEYRRSTACS